MYAPFLPGCICMQQHINKIAFRFTVPHNFNPIVVIGSHGSKISHMNWRTLFYTQPTSTGRVSGETGNLSDVIAVKCTFLCHFFINTYHIMICFPGWYFWNSRNSGKSGKVSEKNTTVGISGNFGKLFFRDFRNLGNFRTGFGKFEVFPRTRSAEQGIRR